MWKLFKLLFESRSWVYIGVCAGAVWVVKEFRWLPKFFEICLNRTKKFEKRNPENVNEPNLKRENFNKPKRNPKNWTEPGPSPRQNDLFEWWKNILKTRWPFTEKRKFRRKKLSKIENVWRSQTKNLSYLPMPLRNWFF